MYIIYSLIPAAFYFLLSLIHRTIQICHVIDCDNFKAFMF